MHDWRNLAEGAIRKELGLELAALRLGLEVAKAHLERGAAAEAMRIYAALVLCEPSDIDFQVGLSNCALSAAENHLALQAASAVIALAPADPRGYLLSGFACLALGHRAEALEDVKDAVAFGLKANDAPIVHQAKELLRKLIEPGA